MVERFRTLFQGGNLGYGEWNHRSGATTHRGEVRLEAYEAHLAGQTGLGIVPVTTTGTVTFAAIDIDINTIDHLALLDKVRSRRMPLHVCRSKSGGAHLYLFAKDPLSAAAIRVMLREWAGLLGYPRAEIFPKQDFLAPDNIGNWINLPYFDGDRTTRYCINEHGAMAFQEFLDSVTYYSPEVNIDRTVDITVSKMPPCLAAISQKPLPEGGRNVTLFNMAVFYRKSSPNDWETRIVEHNKSKFEEPLPYREVDAVIRSTSRARYQYQCEQSPLRENCDRALCIKTPYGINHMPWQESDAFDNLVVGHLRKLTTTPPRYIIEVNGKDLEVSLEELLKFQSFRSRVYEDLDLMVAPQKQPAWEQQIRELTAQRETIEAPSDASPMGLVLEKLHDFLALRNRARSREDILRGLPVEDGEFIFFKVSDFRRYLHQYKLDRVEGAELFLSLRHQGCEHKSIRVNGKVLNAWAYPLKKVNEVSEDLAIAEFKEMDEEL